MLTADFKCKIFHFEEILSFDIGCDVTPLLLIGDPFLVFAVRGPGHAFSVLLTVGPFDDNPSCCLSNSKASVS